VRPWTHTSFAQQLIFGPGAIKRLPELLRSLGLRRVLLVTTQGRHDSDDGARVRTALGSGLASTFAIYDTLDDALDSARAGRTEGGSVRSAA
jgi:alcohol dehydrogenase class IV